MKYILKEINSKNKEIELKRNAGGKAPKDVENILKKNGFETLFFENAVTEKNNANLFYKMSMHLKRFHLWNCFIKSLNPGDTLVVQYPLLNHTVFIGKIGKKLKRKKVKLIVLIHDLGVLRKTSKRNFLSKMRLGLEEVSILKKAYRIIAHNEKMKKKIVELGIEDNRIIPLELFDYLLDKDKNSNSNFSKELPVIIAANLRNDKAGYAYKLPNNQKFNLYGSNYTEKESKDNVAFCGEFEPEELVEKMVGSFGLVWDGQSSETCEGNYGEYLKYNNPHKTSLYLVAGIPVIVWSKAAIADFVLKYGCGFTVDSLNEIAEKISRLSEKEYDDMKTNCYKLSKKIQDGFFTKNAVLKSESV